MRGEGSPSFFLPTRQRECKREKCECVREIFAGSRKQGVGERGSCFGVKWGDVLELGLFTRGPGSSVRKREGVGAVGQKHGERWRKKRGGEGERAAAQLARERVREEEK